MARFSLLVVAVGLAVNASGCTHCDTCDDFPLPNVGNMGPAPFPSAYGTPPIPGSDTVTGHPGSSYGSSANSNPSATPNAAPATSPPALPGASAQPGTDSKPLDMTKPVVPPTDTPPPPTMPAPGVGAPSVSAPSASPSLILPLADDAGSAVPAVPTLPAPGAGDN